MFSLICGRYIQKINIYTKANMIAHTSQVEYVGNSRTTLWNSGEEGKGKRTIVKNVEIPHICAGRGHTNMY
jgi:hypothetical protein